MGRKILAVIVAWIAATATMMIIEMGNSTMFASPSEAVMKDPAALRAYMASGPVAAYVVVLVGYCIASFVGGFIVTKIARRETTGVTLPIIVGVLLELAMVANILLLPGQPVWFMILGLLTFVPMSLLGHRFAR